MSAPLVADIEDLISVLPFFRDRGSYISAPLVSDIEDLISVLPLFQR